ncbi:CDP-alcohol phosphatidyltransferase family protein, partial [Nostoc sp. NIES-2111]
GRAGMLDGMMRPLIDPPLRLGARALVRAGIGADAVTTAAFAFGMACAACATLGWDAAAMVLLALGRIGDGLDGAVARLTQRTDRGGFFDIVADFAFYGAFPLAFAVRDPAANALPAAALLFTFYVNGATFLAYAAVAARRGLETTSRGVKSLYFTAGLAEGTETIVWFALMLLFPSAFPMLAWIFAAMCLATAGSRFALAWRNLG